jgi:hypothetical protein
MLRAINNVLEPMSRRLQHPKFVSFATPLERMDRVLEVLNGEGLSPKPVSNASRQVLAEYEKKKQLVPPILRGYVQTWLTSGPDLSKFAKDNYVVWGNVIHIWRQMPPALFASHSGTADLVLPGMPWPEPWQEAIRLFIDLILNPLSEKLAGPCCRCSRYYIGRRLRKNKLYCSRSCGSRTTATRATRKRREDEHRDKVLRAREASRQWEKVQTNQDWKLFVSTRQPDISLKWLTRAVNRGELATPVRRSKREN